VEGRNGKLLDDMKILRRNKEIKYLSRLPYDITQGTTSPSREL
jgi:hypothetical protein